MKHYFIALLLSLLSSQLIAQEPAAATSKEELATRLQTALQNRDTLAIERLFYWDGATAPSKQADLNAFNSFFDETLEEGNAHVTAAPMDPNLPLEQVSKGFHLQPNIQVTGLLIATYTVGKGQIRVNRPFGVVNGAYYLAATRLRKVEWSGPKDRIFRITVSDNAQSSGSRFNGHIHYNASGINLQRRFEKAKTSKWAIPAQQINQVVVNRLEGDTPITVTVTRGPVILYKETLSANQTQLMYQKPPQ